MANTSAAVIDENLQISPSTRIGAFTQSQVNAIEVIDGKTYFAITDFSTIGEVYILDDNGNIESSYNVGVGPGDFALWKSN